MKSNAYHLKVQQLEKWYGSHKVFSSLDLKLNSGITFLYGKNGCGKSTLLSILAGSDSKFNGSIELNDISIRKAHRSYVKMIGYAPDELKFFPDVSVNQFFNFVIYQRKIQKTALVEELCDEFEFCRHSAKNLGALSLGNAKKLLLITALMIDSKMLLFDEPLNGLDLSAKLAFMKRLNKDVNKIILISSHRSESYTGLNYTIRNFNELNSRSKNFI